MLCQKFINKNLPENASGQAYRVCERFALIAVAGELASHFEITGWQAGEANHAAVTCFNAWLEQRGSATNQEKPRILSRIKAFFETHGESRFSGWHDPHSRTSNRAGFKKQENNRVFFYVLPECFRALIIAWRARYSPPKAGYI
jgi:putative DNA primase/helicase